MDVLPLQTDLNKWKSVERWISNSPKILECSANQLHRNAYELSGAIDIPADLLMSVGVQTTSKCFDIPPQLFRFRHITLYMCLLCITQNPADV